MGPVINLRAFTEIPHLVYASLRKFRKILFIIVFLF